jgi:tyrosyl-tRNA synthetase
LLGVYQYILNLTDDIIEPLLFKLTFIGAEEIAAIIKKNSKKPESNFAKIALAKELIAYISASTATADQVANYSKYFSMDLAAIVASPDSGSRRPRSCA